MDVGKYNLATKLIKQKECCETFLKWLIEPKDENGDTKNVSYIAAINCLEEIKTDIGFKVNELKAQYQHDFDAL